MEIGHRPAKEFQIIPHLRFLAVLVQGQRQKPGEESLKGRRGAPKGNQNARKHGFYSKVLDEAEQLDFELATSVDGIDDEIALLRVKIKSLLERDPENIKLIMEATNTLARLIRTRYTGCTGT